LRRLARDHEVPAPQEPELAGAAA
ncbi:MAG: hypothetical protein QOI35_2572, partial [Cryptosporangiaceae bacterium]|nr:hypothetical protein [Cryptosporangiaceae bacterium]